LIPNVLDESVPIGKDESDNVIISYYKEPKKSSNSPDHVDITKNLNVVDLERAAKISGSRFYFLKNALVRMNLALINFAIDFLEKQDYSLVQPPFLIRRDAMNGAVILNDFDPYKIENEDLYLIGTSEHALVSMHMDEIIEGNKLPLRYAGISPCFRKEAGAHGKDMKGIFRVHQFDKVEQVVFTRPEYSTHEQNRMLNITESFYKELDIPYRVVELCSGDLGKVSSKTYDIEAWMPGQNAYREIVSCSNCVDYQARRLRIRFRDRTNEETKLVHTLNSTLVATERTIVAILENYYNSDGTITVPKVLQKYMGDLQVIS
jgi:seryl-tRNA synthetase